jgi:hypothetical protein
VQPEASGLFSVAAAQAPGPLYSYAHAQPQLHASPRRIGRPFRAARLCHGALKASYAVVSPAHSSDDLLGAGFPDGFVPAGLFFVL